MNFTIPKLYMWVGGLVLLAVLGAFGFFAYRTVVNFETRLARIEEHEAQLVKDKQALEQVALEEKTKREAAEAQIADLMQQIENRKNNATATVAKVMKDKPAAETKQDVETYLKVPVNLTPDGKFEFNAFDVKQFVANKVFLDQVQADNADLRKQVELQQQQITSLQTELTQTKNQLTETEKVMKEYKGVVKKSKLRKVLDVAARVGEGAVAAMVGYGIGRAF